MSNLVLMLVFLFIILFYSIQSYKNLLLDEFLQKQVQLNNHVKNALDRSIEIIESLAAATTNNSTLINSVNNYSKEDTSQQKSVFSKNMNHNLSVVAYSERDIVSVNLVMEDFDFYTTLVNSVYDYNRYYSDAYREKVRSSNSCWLPTRENDLCMPTFEKYIVSYAKKMYSNKYNGQTLGHLVINLNEQFLYRHMEESLSSGISTILIVDENNIIVSSNDREVLGIPLRETVYEDRMKGYDFAVEDALLEDHIISYKKMEKGWSVVFITDSEAVLSPIYRTGRNTLFFGLLIILLIITANVIITQLIAKSIIRLANYVSKYNSRETFNKKVPVQSKIFEINILTHKFNLMIDQIKQLISSVYKHEKKRRQDEFHILQAQINPHFLYNTLETINWMALEKRQYELSNIVIMLGTFLRLGLNKGKWTYRVRDELNHLNSYIEIQKIRSNGGIVFNSTIDETCLDIIMIKLLIQPIVENSILHGFNKRDGHGTIDLDVRLEKEELVFVITDDGMGMSAELVEDVMGGGSEIGHGIKNVNNRIKLYYGEKYGITIRSEPGKGTETTIRIPQDVPKQDIF